MQWRASLHKTYFLRTPSTIMVMAIDIVPLCVVMLIVTVLRAEDGSATRTSKMIRVILLFYRPRASAYSYEQYVPMLNRPAATM
jgi:hypothetical protein